MLLTCRLRLFSTLGSGGCWWGCHNYFCLSMSKLPLHFPLIINHSCVHLALYLLRGGGSPATEIICHKIRQHLVFSLNKLQGTGSALGSQSKQEKSSHGANYSECSSLNVTVQTEEKQVAEITAYRKKGLNTRGRSGFCAAGTNYCFGICCSAVRGF